MHSSSLIPYWAHIAFFITTILPAVYDASSPTNNVTLGGEAYFVNNAVGLTEEHVCSSSLQQPPPPPPLSSSSSSSGAGRALYSFPIRFFNPQTNRTASFLTRFSFSILPSPLCSSGDGIAFLITSNAESFNQVYNMGLPEIGSDDEDNSFIAVEFDTNMDPTVGDINGNHVGIDVNSFRSIASVDLSPKGINLSDGRHITAWIEYKDSEKATRIWMSYDPVKPPNPVLDAQIDLSKYLKEFMHVGFTASNGHGSAVHLVDRWRFKTSWLFSSTLPMDTVDEGGGECIMCSIEELGYAHQPYNLITKKGSARELTLIFCGIAAFAFAFAFTAFAVIFTYCIWRRRRLGKGSFGGRSGRIQFDKVPARFLSAEIKAATAGFSKKRIIGEGASGTVYHGFFPNGKQVAVKRFNRCNRVDGFVNPFSTEIATLARCLRHRNLVQLLGWCCEHTEWVLVYEYMPNGSLDQILHKTSDSVNVLSWEQRVNIVHGVASALIYLHEECDKQIIHRDVKACNVMLDADFTAKLGDFGLAEVYEHASVPREATTPAGTVGYLAPEYVYSGLPTIKTDVYSFGVVVLEVASGSRPVDDHGIVLVDWVWKLWEKGKLIESVDSRLMGRYSRLEMERMLKVGLLCVHPNCEKRPLMRETARMLRGEMQIPLLPAKKPTGKLQSHLLRDVEELVHSDGDEIHAGDDSTWMTPKTHFGH